MDFTLLAKIYLREIWSRKLDWDTPLSSDLTSKWVSFFTTLFQLEHLRFPRRLRPEDAVGRPWLIILSDGSDLAYGYAAYIRWSLQSGLYWCRLIMAKCHIAPVNKLSTPQIELNAAVLSKRGRRVIESEMRFDFERVLQLVDSETVLSMIHKTSTRFKVYEGVRIGEIQAATDGDLSSWAWISGEDNTADWLTRGRLPDQLGEDSHWWNGPPILDDQTFLETSPWLHFPEIVVTLELLHSIQWHQQHWSLGIVPQGSLSSFVVSIECVPSLICCQV